MSITILRENDYSKAYFDIEKKVGVIEWKPKKLTVEEYKEPFIQLNEFAAKNKNVFRNFISDTRQQSVVSPENRDWFTKNMIPMAIESGLKRGAVIITGNAFKKYYLNMIIKGSRKFAIDIKVFDDPEKAWKWIEKFDD
jgi:hypothetical protein